MSTYLRFNRYKLFTIDMMKEHSSLINDVEDYTIENDGYDAHFVNRLNGIWDGYLYTDLLTHSMEYPAPIYERVLDIYRTISNFIESENTQVFDLLDKMYAIANEGEYQDNAMDGSGDCGGIIARGWEKWIEKRKGAIREELDLTQEEFEQGYKEGQVQAIIGNHHFHREIQPDSSVVWMELTK